MRQGVEARAELKQPRLHYVSLCGMLHAVQRGFIATMYPCNALCIRVVAMKHQHHPLPLYRPSEAGNSVLPCNCYLVLTVLSMAH